MKKISKKLFLICILSMLLIFVLNIQISYADALGDRQYPYSAWKNQTFNFKQYSWLGNNKLISFKLTDIIKDDAAWKIVYSENQFNDAPDTSSHWILFKFHINYLSSDDNNEVLNGNELINSTVFFTQSSSSITPYDTATLSNLKDPYDIEMYPQNSADFYFGILVDKTIEYPLIRIHNSLSSTNYTWFNTDPTYIEPIIKETQTITVNNYTKKFGDKSFNINAKTNGDGILSYTSSDPSIAEIDSEGNINIKKAGTVFITISASETEIYKEVTKTITLTINKANQSITTSSNQYKKINNNTNFSLNIKHVGNGTLSYNSSNLKVATVNSSGIVSIKGCGIATITIKANATTNYNALTKKITIIVIPTKTFTPSVTSSKSKTMKVTVKKQPTITGFQYQYATNSSYKNCIYSKSTSNIKTFTKLKSKKTYYVRVRAYKVINNKTYYGSWSNTKKIKIK